jgi:hypothetical protein
LRFLPEILRPTEFKQIPVLAILKMLLRNLQNSDAFFWRHEGAVTNKRQRGFLELKSSKSKTLGTKQRSHFANSGVVEPGSEKRMLN